MTIADRIANGNLITYWHLDETANTTRYDYAGAREAIDNNTVGTAAGIISSTTASFTRSNSEYLRVTADTPLEGSSGDITWGGWVYITDISSAANFWSIWDTPPGLSWTFQVLVPGAPPGRIRALVSGDGTNVDGTITADNASIGEDTWYFFLFEHLPGSNQFTAEVDRGTTTTDSYSSGIFSSGADMTIGVDDATSNYHDGRIQGLFMFDVQLTSSEKDELYNGGNGLDLRQFLGIGSMMTIM